MEELSMFEQYPIFQIVSYIITVVIGGVGYKFYQLYTSNKQTNRQLDSSDSQKLIGNLTERVEKLTTDLERFEKERNEIHKRELERERELAEAKAKVRILSERVDYLEEKLLSFKEENDKYKEKYGNIG